MRQLIASLSVLAAACAAPLAVQTSAHANPGSPGCVTHTEFNGVKKGWTKARVDAKFGTKGHREAFASSGGFKTSIWSYNTCAQFAAVAISYDKHGSGPWKLSAKSGVFV